MVKSPAEKTEGDLAQVGNEINALRTSSQLYNVVQRDKFSTKDAEGGVTLYNKKTGAVDMVVGGFATGLIAHEFHHGFQFDQGEIQTYDLLDKQGNPIDVPFTPMPPALENAVLSLHMHGLTK